MLCPGCATTPSSEKPRDRGIALAAIALNMIRKNLPLETTLQLRQLLVHPGQRIQLQEIHWNEMDSIKMLHRVLTLPNFR